ncbi:hypothetical protein EH228_19030 [Erwinia endophytica]|uniref:hypothetical protein n=1 Tax=Erwinia endophytica TaxID=1563158 RepID=UPI001265FEB9|nr:hypothetical protein [Erwinia endophytica]KAB8305896.1 hypothetical protein EH228_19030 [Erwinia endophytica]
MDRDNYVSEKDVRKCQFYVRYMERKARTEISLLHEFEWQDNSGNVEEMCYWINKELSQYFRKDAKDIEGFVTRMAAACNDEILPLVKFDWIKNDSRICLWLWHQKISYSYRRGDVFPEHRGRFEALVEYFDYLNESGNRKRELLDKFRGDWQRKGNTSDPFVSESAEVINYLWRYSIKLHDNITRNFSPISDEDRKICLTGFYDCILDTPEKKELFLRKIKSALSSHKHREKAGKGNINKNFLLSMNNNEKLNEMIMLAGIKRDDFMNRLIADEYERRNTGKLK